MTLIDSYDWAVKLQLKQKNIKLWFVQISEEELHDWVVSTLDFGSQGPWFESHWRQNSAHDFTVLHCTEHFIIILPSA